MTPEAFVYWLNGVFEIGDLKTLNEHQVAIVKQHIAVVLHKVTPPTRRESLRPGACDPANRRIC